MSACKSGGDKVQIPSADGPTPGCPTQLPDCRIVSSLLGFRGRQRTDFAVTSALLRASCSSTHPEFESQLRRPGFENPGALFERATPGLSRPAARLASQVAPFAAAPRPCAVSCAASWPLPGVGAATYTAPFHRSLPALTSIVLFQLACTIRRVATCRSATDRVAARNGGHGGATHATCACGGCCF